jgi:transposase-like protein
MTMNCPLCGAMMVWLNGSILHERLVKNYHCRVCDVNVIKNYDGSYELAERKVEKLKKEK